MRFEFLVLVVVLVSACFASPQYLRGEGDELTKEEKAKLFKEGIQACRNVLDIICPEPEGPVERMLARALEDDNNTNKETCKKFLQRLDARKDKKDGQKEGGSTGDGGANGEETTRMLLRELLERYLSK